MAVPTDPLIVSRIIGDVVDMFVPRVTMNVYYGPNHVTNGCNIKPSITSNSPIVAINGYSHELYTLIMTDPDAPSPSEPSLREWVHWIVTDIPGDSNPIQGNEILPYIGLEPQLGIHRFILLLFAQKAPLGMVEQPLSRANFSTRAFAHQLDLGRPVATVYFNAQKERSLRRRPTSMRRRNVC